MNLAVWLERVARERGSAPALMLVAEFTPQQAPGIIRYPSQPLFHRLLLFLLAAQLLEPLLLLIQLLLQLVAVRAVAGRPQRRRQGDQPLLGAVVQVALDAAPVGVPMQGEFVIGRDGVELQRVVHDDDPAIAPDEAMRRVAESESMVGDRVSERCAFQVVVAENTK